MYPSPFCNLSRRHWMGGGVQVGCGADGAPTGRLMVPAAGGAGWRPVPTEPPPDTEPPASLPGTLGNGPTGQTPPGTPRQIPGHYAFVRGCTGFLEAWKARNYGALGSYFPNSTNRTPSAQACEARELCFSHPIEGYEIEETVRPAAAVANQR